MGPVPTPLVQRLARRARRSPSGCLEWQGARLSSGYGYIRVGPADGYPARRMELVHRAAWVAAGRALAPGEMVLHRCDNPPCFELEHLFPGDAAANSADAVSKNRMHPKIGIAERVAIAADPRSSRAVARDHGLSHRSVLLIRRRAAS